MLATPQRLCDPSSLTDSYVTYVTAQNDELIRLSRVVFVNYTSSAKTASLRAVPSGATAGDHHQIYITRSIPAYKTWSADLTGFVLEAGDTLDAKASASTSVSIHVHGVVIK